MPATEYVILVNNHNQSVGKAEKLYAHKNNLLHRAFSIFIFHEERLLIQQRAREKYHSAGLWTNTCCSHPRPGEDILEAGQRRLQEEIGILTPLKEAGVFHYNAHFDNGLSENEMDHVLIGEVSESLVLEPNPKEVLDYRWVQLDDLAKEITQAPNTFTFWLPQALNLVREYCQRLAH